MHAMQYYDIVGTAEADFGVHVAVVADQICSKACPNMYYTSLTQISPTSYSDAIHLPSHVHGSELENMYETTDFQRVSHPLYVCPYRVGRGSEEGKAI